jgi:thiol-disulfide isomerase/thioredoxin
MVGADTVPAAPGPVSLGKADFDWKLERLDGSELSLGAFRGRVLFIHMWATWCRPCVREMAEIEALIDSLDREDVAFLLVSPEEARTVQGFLRTYGYEVPVFLEKEEMPGTFIVGREGRIVLKRRGAANWNQDPIRAFLRKLAESEPGLGPRT